MIHLLLAVTMIDLPRYLPLKTSSVYFPPTLFIDSHWWMANLSCLALCRMNLPTTAVRGKVAATSKPSQTGEVFSIHSPALRSPDGWVIIFICGTFFFFFTLFFQAKFKVIGSLACSCLHVLPGSVYLRNSEIDVRSEINVKTLT